MFGESFVLVKPDGLELNLEKKIICKLEQEEVWVTEQKDIYLKMNDIMNIWPYTQSDVVSRELFKIYLCGKRCKLLILESSYKDIHKKVSDVKRYFRRKYGRHQYLSIMHTPGNNDEFIKDMYVLQGKENGLVKNNTVIGLFKCYSELTYLKTSLVAKRIMKYMGLDYVEHIKRIGIDMNYLVVYKNGINDSYYLVGILRDNLGYSFELCYYLAYSVNYYKSFPIMIISESDAATKIINILEDYSYKSSIMKGESYLNG